MKGNGLKCVALAFALLNAGPVLGMRFGTAAAAPNSSASQTAQELVSQAANVAHQIQADPRFDALLKRAKGVFIMPNLVKAALLVGMQGAQGVLVKHEADGRWSDPAFFTIGADSIGAEAGAKAGPAAFILMTDKALNDFTQHNNFSLSAKSGITVINYSAQGQAPIGKGDIAVWSNQSGLFAGASASGADITVNTGEDRAYYGNSMSTVQIIKSTAPHPGADSLHHALPV